MMRELQASPEIDHSEKRMLRLPVPVNFVFESAFDDAAARASTDIDELIRRDPSIALSMNGSKADLNMIALTYFYLREAGFTNIKLSKQPVPGCINIVHSDHLIRMTEIDGCFIACVEGDFPRRLSAHFRILQNQSGLSRYSACIWIWPQPGNIQGPSENDRFTCRAGYFGQTYNGNLAWNENAWRELLKPIGFEFSALPPERWNDFANVDVAIAIRSFDTRPYRKKPPSKLVNAWIAGVPFIGGADSAFAQVGTPGSDYLLATTPDELCEQLLRLRDEPDLRQSLVRNGLNRSRAFTRNAIMQMWINVLEGPVEMRYRKWARRPAIERVRWRFLRWLDFNWSSTKRLVRKILARWNGWRR